MDAKELSQDYEKSGKGLDGALFERINGCVCKVWTGYRDDGMEDGVRQNKGGTTVECQVL